MFTWKSTSGVECTTEWSKTDAPSFSQQSICYLAASQGRRKIEQFVFNGRSTFRIGIGARIRVFFVNFLFFGCFFGGDRRCRVRHDVQLTSTCDSLKSAGNCAPIGSRLTALPVSDKYNTTSENRIGRLPFYAVGLLFFCSFIRPRFTLKTVIKPRS